VQVDLATVAIGTLARIPEGNPFFPA